jgi:hypothetical protein
MSMAPIPLFALTASPLGVALSDGPEFASMALLALVLAALSLAARRHSRPGHGHDHSARGRRPADAATRARS